MRIILIEDDFKIARFVRGGLEAEGHIVDVVGDGNEGAKRAVTGGYDLVLLDLMLPGCDGFEVLETLRRVDRTTPVLVLTARGEVEDRVRGLDLGADDYIVKPFSFLELRARMRALLRRSHRSDRATLRVGGLFLDRVRRTASLGKLEVELSAREFHLLELFMNHPDEPLSRATIADRVWGVHFDTGTNVIDVYVNYLRGKLKNLGIEPIRTMRGIGYQLDLSALEPKAVP